MKFGIDLDNTIISYRDSLQQCTKQVFPELEFDGFAKEAIKTVLLSQPQGMEKWMRLQGILYGHGLQWARPFQGVVSFIKQAQAGGHDVVIVSHKTVYGHYDKDKINLHDAALSWLNQYVFAGLVDVVDVHFCLTQDEKVLKITDLSCDVFIDDLVEIFQHPTFPESTRAIHFIGEGKKHVLGSGSVFQYSSWLDMIDLLKVAA